MRVLIVDDQDTTRTQLTSLVTGFGYQCLSVDTGEQAVAVWPAFAPDIVLLDVLMPGMSGFATAPELKALAGDVHLPIIFITALDDQQTLLQCLESGGDDFINKPFAPVVLEAKLRLHGRNRELSMTLADKNRALAYHSSRVEREHQIVEHIFQNSLARNYLDYPHLHAYLSPLSMFNGDLLLAAPGPLGNMYFFLGDFTGHGLSAAVGALPVSQTFFGMAEKGASVGDIVRDMNARLHELLPTDMFLAGLLIELSASGERLTYWNGGIPPAQLIRPGGRVESVMAPQTLALGILNDTDFDGRVSSLKVSSEDSLLLYTDGLTELDNGEGMLGSEGVQALLKSMSTMAELTSWVQQRMRAIEQRDDVSMAWLRCKPTGLKQSLVPAALSPLPFSLSFNLTASEIKAQDPINRIVTDLANVEGLHAYRSQLFTVLQEIYNNAVEHGLLQLDSKLKQSVEGFETYYQRYAERLEALSNGWIELSLDYQPQQQQLTICITDSGNGFSPETPRFRHPSCPDEVYGRGLTLVKELTSEMHWSKDGRTLLCILPLKPLVPAKRC